MSITTNLRRLLLQRLQAGTVRGLADELGVPSATIQKFSDGTIKRPRLDLCECLARGLGYEITLESGNTNGNTECQSRSMRGNTPSRKTLK
jgi:hypothetical protein